MGAEALLVQTLDDARVQCTTPPEDEEVSWRLLKDAVEGQQHSAPGHTTALLQAELVMIRQCISAHEAKETALLCEASKRKADWQERKAALDDEVLRASLQMKTVNAEFSAFKGVA